jgi:hypothetical protein
MTRAPDDSKLMTISFDRVMSVDRSNGRGLRRVNITRNLTISHRDENAMKRHQRITGRDGLAIDLGPTHIDSLG